ncbi:EboA family metabolite traffic protein [Oculatella sp. LEGE 06141]|uniref:EboA family metabolite traffic protein n=1 Tax=Oculatella sp. LEGE 06141 TaxID=1828648 RepID=UPI001881EE66|nr:EboA family metabolite traffic protein [Oculatella sp. LEGE 06141]MBE9181450.1 EboA family metabolite traffic protein [Oculatella sp. LEGE 06141]
MSAAINRSVSLSSAVELLQHWLSSHLSPSQWVWFQEQQTQIAQGAPLRRFFAAFSAVPRFTGKATVEMPAHEQQQASVVCEGWEPQWWSLDQMGRTLLLLSLPHDNPATYGRSLDPLFTAADVRELVALYQALPLLPYPEQHRARAAEGIRSNMTPVFNAIALHNPYPARYFDEGAWNQLVLKAMFVGSPLHLIWGLDHRANPTLAQMSIDYVHERWAAHRTITPEIWRLVGRFAGADLRADLDRALHDADPVQRSAAAIACSQSPAAEIRSLLNHDPDLQRALQEGRLTWHHLTHDQHHVE